MRRSPKMIVLLVLAPFLTGMLGARAVELPGTIPEHPAGCHSHGPAVPTPAPTSFQCCAIGHHWAMPGKVFPVNPAAMIFSDTAVELSPGIDFQSQGFASIFRSASPPESVPLRI